MTTMMMTQDARPLIKHGSLFSGIGGFDLAAEWMGWENSFHCEWNPFGQRILKHYWPHATSYEDITKTNFSLWRGRIDVLSGGFPCQPYSNAGKRKGTEDDRHLWPQMLRAIREIHPRYIVGENVRGLTNWNGGLVFDQVQAEMEAEGYEVLPFLLPACAVNAPHRRDRIWFVAYARHHAKGATGDSTTNAGLESTALPQARQSGNISPIFDNGFRHLQRIDLTNPNHSRTNEQQLRVKRKWKAKDKRRKKQPLPKPWTLCHVAPNASYIGCGGREDRQCQVREWEFLPGEQAWCKVGDKTPRCSRKWLAPSYSTRSGFETEGEFTVPTAQNKRIGDSSGRWEWFPTQSPICGGDDGIPRQLDGITFPKWRTESIKSFGNAIVPQVALEIFKVIQQMEDNNNNNNA